MEQLNKKRNDLKNQQQLLNTKIGTREEKQSYLVKRKNELEFRQNELNCKSDTDLVWLSPTRMWINYSNSLCYFLF